MSMLLQSSSILFCFMNIQLLFIEFTVLKKINENVKQKLNTILLIGNTGSGKSFIFNWVSGAKFEYSNGELKFIQSEGQNFSVQSNAMQSVTYIPNFNKIDEDYLIIDFPGFKDKKGKYSQLSIKLMFDEIVTKTNVKIAVVLYQPTTKLEERGAHIQEFIQSAFTSQNTKFDSIGLIINKFSKKVYEDSIKQIQKQIIEKSLVDKTNENVYQALSKQIIIMEDVYYDNIVDVLSENARQSVISRLKQISPISYQPDYQDENQVVSSYIKQELEKIFKKYNKTLQKQKVDAKSNKYQLQNFINTLKDLIKQLNEISQNDCDPQTQLIKHFISKIEQSKDEKQSQEKFFCIYQYFFKYKESISGYQYFKDKKKQLKKIIKLFIDELQERTRNNENLNGARTIKI
ncbi:unnamed protein product [Paramecium pentaurelia]|uniref:G domain-containing protein n=1 Tax=Paramecium pentaurelia TaxID=43138 RepID=A0A8S1X1T2_9CILI|nr:unnamed protein product [Paramecium pentaurelia]